LFYLTKHRYLIVKMMGKSDFHLKGIFIKMPRKSKEILSETPLMELARLRRENAELRNNVTHLHNFVSEIMKQKFELYKMLFSNK
jgi:hypothetical protein